MLPAGDDPDNYIRKRGAAAYQELLRNSRQYLDYLLDRTAAEDDLSTDEGRRSFLGKMLAVAARIPDAAQRDQFADRLSHKARITEEVVRAEIRKAAVQRQTSVEDVQRRVPNLGQVKVAERGLIWALMVRRRGNATLALAAAFIPFFTAAYRYSDEARPYGLMMAFAALAWLAWTEAARGTRRALFLSILGVALAAGLWNHYFAALVFAPIAAGELVRSIRDRRVDRSMWLVIIGALAAAAPLYRLLRDAAAQTRHFWVRPSIADIAGTYQFLFATLASGFAGWTLLAIAAAIVVSLFRPAARVPGLEPIPAHEVAAAAVAVLLPAIGVVLALIATGAFVPRYAMPTVAAVSVVLPLALARLARRAPLVDAVLLAAVVGPYVVSAFTPIARPEDPIAARPLLVRSLQMPGRTVAAGQLWFLQLWFYAPPTLKPRVVYLADPDLALRYTGSDIVDRNYLALARWTPVPIERFDTFIDHNPGFRVYSAGAGWLLDGLRDHGAIVETAGSEAGGQLYQVTLAPGRTIPR